MDGHIAGDVRDVGVEAQRVELSARHFHHRAAMNPLFQPRSVADRQLVDRCVAGRHDDIRRRFESTGQAIREVAR